MNLAEGIAQIEGMIRCVDGIPAALSQTGEEYLELRPDINPAPALSGFATSESMVVCAFVDAVKRYAQYVADTGGYGDLSALTLYWRISPEIERRDDAVKVSMFTGTGKMRKFVFVPVWHLYARLLVSDKPEIESIEHALAVHAFGNTPVHVDWSGA